MVTDNAAYIGKFKKNLKKDLTKFLTSYVTISNYFRNFELGW